MPSPRSGEDVPDLLDVPIIPQEAQLPEQAATDLIAPAIDGQIADGEWDAAGYYTIQGGAMAHADDLISQLSYGFDARTLYPRFDFRQPLAERLAAEQWRFGGAPGDTNHTRILDLAWPADAAPTQADLLGDYPPSQEPNMDLLGPDDFAQVPMLVP